VKRSLQRPPDADPPVETSPARPDPTAPWWGEGEVPLVLIVLWAASVVRTVGAAAHHEVYGVEATLAFACVFLVPWLFLRMRSRARSRAQAGVPSEPAARPTLRVIAGGRR
jgi:hypothetical protein